MRFDGLAGAVARTPWSCIGPKQVARSVVRTWLEVPTNKDDDQLAAICWHLGFCLSCFALLAYQVISVQPHYCKGMPRVGLRTHGLCVQRPSNREGSSRPHLVTA